MFNLKVPLDIKNGQLVRFDNLKDSIDHSVEMFINTAQGSWVADRDYGFVFTGLRFEIFDESNGTVLNSTDSDDPVYKKKVSGSSKNLDTFASEFSLNLKEYEPRLRDISATMTYIREERIIYLSVRGTVVENSMPYEYFTSIKVWR